MYLRLQWSVQTLNGRPHKYGRQFRTVFTKLMSSRSYTGSLACCGATARLKNAYAPSPWCSIAPNPAPDASQSTMNRLEKSGS